MKILVFGAGNWQNEGQADFFKTTFEEWRNRVRCFCGDPEMFISAGTYSDPKFNPIPSIPVIQNGITTTRPYSRDWNYGRNGFITGCWHSLLNKEFDVLVHVQCRTLLGEDLLTNLHRFMDSDKQIMAPKYVSKTRGIDNSVDIAMMAMKPDAVRTYTSFGIRPSLSPYDQMNSEEEAFELFGNVWYNPWPNVSSNRKRESGIGIDSDDDLSKEEFMKLPMIAAHKHASEEDIKDWCKAHPCKVNGGLL